MLPLFCSFISCIAEMWTLVVPFFVLALFAIVIRISLGRYE